MPPATRGGLTRKGPLPSLPTNARGSGRFRSGDQAASGSESFTGILM